MPSSDNQYLPNDQTIQVDFRPNPRMLDHRGDWTARLVKALDSPDWQIRENQIFVLDKGKAQSIVTFRSCTTTRIDLTSRNEFPAWATKFLSTTFALPGFDDPLSVKRIGVLSRFCTSYQQGFAQLMRQLKERYVDFKSQGQDAVTSPNGSAELIDIGAPLNFTDERGTFNTMCGPMKGDQLKRDYFKYREESALPAVGFFYLIDYFVEPSREMAFDEIIAKANDLAYESWDRHQRVRKLVVGV